MASKTWNGFPQTFFYEKSVYAYFCVYLMPDFFYKKLEKMPRYFVYWIVVYMCNVNFKAKRESTSKENKSL